MSMAREGEPMNWVLDLENSCNNRSSVLQRIESKMGCASPEDPQHQLEIPKEDVISDSVISSDVSDASIASSLSDFMDDATSSSLSTTTPSSSSSSSSLSEHHADGPLYELSSLMSQLPLRKGLSRYFDGKSQSFTSLANVNCIEDLAKPESPYRIKMKACKSYGGGLDHRSYTRRTFSKTISKKASSRGSFSSLVPRSSIFQSHKPPLSAEKFAKLLN